MKLVNVRPYLHLRLGDMKPQVALRGEGWRIETLRTHTSHRRQRSVCIINTRQFTYRDKQVRNLSLVLPPGLAVLVPATLDITHRTVSDHAGEEQRIEPREGATEPSNEAPIKGKVQVTGVVDLACLAICRVSSLAQCMTIKVKI